MKNVLIVESENDKYFIEALISYMSISNVEVSSGTICHIDDYECLEGLGEQKLDNALKATILQAKKKKIRKIGIIIDQDDKTLEERLMLINKSIFNILHFKNSLSTIGELSTIALSENQNIEIGAYLTNVAGKGELETVLRSIKIGDSTHADCLQGWQNCLVSNNVNESNGLKQKDFDKFWVQVYIRFDVCSKHDQKQAGRKCNTQISMSKPIWDFGAECLTEFRRFLTLFAD